MENNGKQNELKHIPLDKIRISKEIPTLRDVNKKKLDYQELLQSVKQDGVISPISVRPITSPDGEAEYAVIDGLQRFSAAQDAGHTTIPAQIMTVEDADLLKKQIIANSHVITTPRANLAKGLRNILNAEPYKTKGDIAAEMRKSVKWVESVLSLINLIPKAQVLLNEEKLPLGNAYSLAKVPAEQQEDLLSAAMTLPGAEFTAAVEQLIKDLKEAKKQGKGDKPAEFVPKEYFRKPSEVKEAIENKKILRAVYKEVFGKDPTKDEAEAMKLALQWSLNVDPPTAAIRKTEWEKKREDEKAEKEAKKAENRQKADAEAKKSRDEADALIEKLKKASEPATV